MGQTFAGVGSEDPRLAKDGKVDFRLRRLLAGYAKTDDPPSRVKPLPLPVLHRVWDYAQASGDAKEMAIADMAYIGFFFLLLPGEFAGAEGHHAFRLEDVQL
ncbi:MAG: hypothetical protein ACRETL_16640 [Gammaproteobacteria bacterium]